MKSINYEAYLFTKEYEGLKEISGPKDTRMIEVAHRLCKVEGAKGGEYTDEIPWCSSWVVLAIICANIRRNPKRTIEMLQRRGIEMSVIKECFAYAKVAFDVNQNVDTLVPVVPPTWSAGSRSWDEWGEAVPFEQAQRGDIIRLTRDGGGHVAFLDEDRMGKTMLRLLGGNQSNKICSSASYSRMRLVQVRRMPEARPVQSFPPPKVSQPVQVSTPPKPQPTAPVPNSPRKKVSFFTRVKNFFKSIFS